jgi:hypothetical protein
MDLSPLPVLQVGLTILRIKSSPILFVSPKKAAEHAPTCFDRAFIFCWRLLPVLNFFAVLLPIAFPPYVSSRSYPVIPASVMSTTFE